MYFDNLKIYLTREPSQGHKRHDGKGQVRGGEEGEEEGRGEGGYGKAMHPHTLLVLFPCHS